MRFGTCGLQLCAPLWRLWSLFCTVVHPTPQPRSSLHLPPHYSPPDLHSSPLFPGTSWNCFKSFFLSLWGISHLGFCPRSIKIFLKSRYAELPYKLYIKLRQRERLKDFQNSYNRILSSWLSLRIRRSILKVFYHSEYSINEYSCL